MTKIFEVLDVLALREQVNVGNIRVQTHPEFPELMIANYTEQAAFNRDWNPITRICRGLIWNNDTGEVLARPFPKFFNFDEKEAPRILDDQVVYSYSNKYDGSLGILYMRPDGKPAIATRGSFASDQAMMATAYITNNPLSIKDDLDLMALGYTPLKEICGPENRIVLQYDDFFLAHLGYIHIAEGTFMPHWSMALHGKRTMRDCLMDLSRTNAEGWVVWKSNQEAVKIKQADYVELHRIVSNLSKKEVWRQLRAGTYNDFKIKLPDEWHAWAEAIADDLREQFTAIDMKVKLSHSFLHARKLDTRKEQAAWVFKNVPRDYAGLVFGLLDGRDIADAIWRMIEPRGDD
jgi:RNA ligase